MEMMMMRVVLGSRLCFYPPFRSIVNGTFSEVKEAMFAHMPSLQLL